MLRFSLATDEDMEQVLATYNASIPHRLATADTEPQTLAERKSWFEKHGSSNRPVWMLHLDGHYAGWMSFSDFYGRPAYSTTAELSVYLEEKYQGRGLGKKALEYAIAEAPKFSIRRILGFVFGHNTASIRLFKSCGFEEWAHFPGVANLDGQEKDLVIFGIVLTETK